MGGGTGWHLGRANQIAASENGVAVVHAADLLAVVGCCKKKKEEDRTELMHPVPFLYILRTILTLTRVGHFPEEKSSQSL